MYFKALEIQGFKSFADKIQLEFGQGITSIVGPNGSGKSNISDSVRWVMGEQSAKTLRGNKMEDVIFAGTQLRKPVGFAEVSITLDNEDKALPIDYNEVTITRRVFRSGEGEYYINRSLCRLKDIHELFMDTGLGRDGYSIIGQGKIDEILSTKSEERRQIFEEAAGITKYRYRKEEAEKKLELTNDNLTRIKDIITELETQIGPLQQQAEKARRFLDLREELKALEINVALDVIERLKKSLEEVEKNYKNVDQQLKEEEQKFQKTEADIETLFNTANERENESEQARTVLHEKESVLKTYQNDINLLTNNIDNNNVNINRINAEAENLEKKTVELFRELEDRQKELEKFKTHKKTVQDEIVELEEKNDQIVKSIEDENALIDSLKADAIEKMNSISDFRGKMNSLTVLENNFLDRSSAVEKDLAGKKAEEERLGALIVNLDEEIEEGQSEINSINKKILDSRKNISSLTVHYNQIKNELNQLVIQRNEKNSKKNLLAEMEKDYEGYSKSVKSILTEAKSGRLKHLAIHGPISQLINVQEKFITAIEIALGAAMQNIVVEKEEDAKKAIEYLKSTKLGRATFLPVSSINGRTLDEETKASACPGFLGIASKLVQYDGKYKGIFENLLGRVVIVDHIDAGISMAKKFGYKFRIVTLEGDVLNPGGSLTGGSTNKTTSFLSRTNEIKELEIESKKIQERIDALNKASEAKGRELEKESEGLKEQEKELKDQEALLIKLEADLRHNKVLSGSLTEAQGALERERVQLDEQIRNTKNDLNLCKDSIKMLEEQVKEAEEIIHMKQSSHKEELEERERIRQVIVDKKMLFSSINKDIDVCIERIDNYHHDVKELKEEYDGKKHEQDALAEKNRLLNGEIESKNTQINELGSDINGVQEKLRRLHTEKNDAEQTIRTLQASMKQKRDAVFVLQEEQRRIENKRTRVELELENTINNLWDDYELTYTTALELKKDIGNISQAQKRINVLKNEIKGLGNINIDAIEEYKNVKERFEFLSHQKNDLEEAKASLLKIINDMLELMKKQFSEKFTIINDHFNEIFSQLFGGGKAGLKLSEPDNVLESGIEIEAQPPGKKLQSLMLLSGGEKAFTAIALLFAILEVRPTPFCFLDEIEAALDDVNVYRFAQYLKQYSNRTQFIIITHRRGTMEASDTLYGVTMQEQGVSKLLQLNIEDAAS